MKDPSNSKICFADFEIDIVRRLLRRNGETLALNPKAFDVLVFFAQNAGRIVSKNEILDAVWEDHFVEEANLKVQISALRKALGEGKNDHRFLVTVPGKGYKFVGEVTNGNGEVVVERHRFSQTSYEHEAEITAKETGKRSTQWIPLTFGAFVVLICVIVAVTGYFYWGSTPTNAPFQNVALKRLTNNGKVAASAISPDGKYLAYVLGEPDGNSLWVQQVGTASQIRILPPMKAEFWDLVFTPDSTHIYYDLFSGDKTDTELYRIPTLGGVIEKIPNVITRSISFSPDGKRFAFISPDSPSNHNYLSVSDADGSNGRIIAKKPHPNTFVYDGRFVAWSPDGKTIAAVVNNLEADSNYASIVLVDVENGNERAFGSHRWQNVGSITWHKRGLLVTGGDKTSSRNQISHVPPDGEPMQITNDLNSYHSVSLTADGNAIAALQNTTTSSIFVRRPDTKDFRELVSEVGGLSPLVWNGDKIVFRSTADGKSNLAIMNSDGSDRRQLTADADVSERGLAASPDGKYFVFASWRSGKSNLWRIDADGRNLTQLTDGEADAYPRFTPDGQTVVYQRGILTSPMLWKVSITGGEPTQVTDFDAKWGAISADGEHISYFHMVHDRWRIGFTDPNGKPSLRDIDVPANLSENTVYWDPYEKSLWYIGTVGSVGNLWSLAVDGSGAKPVTQFTSHSLADFAPSRDGKMLAVVRTLSLSDVVLIENAVE